MGPPPEEFSLAQTIDAVGKWIEFGEANSASYYSGTGWAARCLRSHLEDLKDRERIPAPETAPHFENAFLVPSTESDS